jgi:hydrogenase-1 operon protein HyaF
MKPFPLPVRAIGPGSQPPEEVDFDYLPMPREMNTFSMPMLPQHADAANMAQARVLLERFLERFDRWRQGEARLDLAGADEGAVKILNETLGEGEVAIRIVGPREIRIQETVFAGVWRERHFDERGAVVHDWLQACGIPPTALAAAREAARPTLAPLAVPPGAMNAPALLHEIGEQMAAPHAPGSPHVINLTLLPLSPEDQGLLEAALPAGPVAILSRGFGNCRIGSTAARNVWRVQYFNNMQTLILNTLEIVDVPEVALAADEDLADSRERLNELVDWMAETE